MTTSPAPRRTARQIRRWREYLADERTESASYRELGERRTGEEREILLALADAEKRHESHWLDLLGDAAERDGRSREDAIACYLSGADGWREAVKLLGGTFAHEEAKLRSGSRTDRRVNQHASECFQRLRIKR